jgi:hypothetical protein
MPHEPWRIAFAAAALLLAGCAETKQPVEPPPADRSADSPGATKLAAIEAELAALRQAGDPDKPSVAKLEAIDSEIRALIVQQAPPAAPVPLAPPADKPVADAFAIHLATYKLKDSVADGWTEYRKLYGAVLDGLEPRVATVDLQDGRGTLYRLKAGPFASAAAAGVACKKVAAFPGGYCKVMDFTGTPGTEFWRH